MADKNELRIRAKNIRKNLPMKEISAKLADLIRQNEIYISARNVMLFYPTEFEVDLRELFNDDKNFYLPKVDGEKLLICPYICRHSNADLLLMRHSSGQNFQIPRFALNDGKFCHEESFNECTEQEILRLCRHSERSEESPYKSPQNDISLQKSSFGIYEPCSEPASPKILDLVIVPALMCDENGCRLGYGGGFYDRFISKYGKNFKTICAIPKELFTQNLPHDKFDQKIDEIVHV